MITSEAFTKILLSGNEELAVEQAVDYTIKNSKQAFFEHIMTPAMYDIGRMWQANEITVADEHLATGISDFVITVIDQQFRTGQNGERTVLLFGVEKEEHYLGLKMVASLFRDQGWTTRYMGPNLPVDSALSAMKKWDPDVIGLSASMSDRVPDVLTYLESLNKDQKRPLTVLIGGRFAEDVAKETHHFPVKIIKTLTEFNLWLEDEGGDLPHDTV